ncbi:FAD-dependent oxidoreductase [Streptomyces sp. NPDC006544]|uniref:NAD(P)/FAD-dependent oxidoreductase n=1 Tax=Streptomyces sp. NPDC006544 TaxID=3154583 RepID=UPI0033A1BD4A
MVRVGRVSEQTEQTEHTQRAVVVVGAGMAGVQTAVALREQGWTGPVTLLGAEPHQPYDRPPLSKAVLLGKAEDSAFDVDFEGLDIELRLGVEVTGLRAAERELDTEAGPVPYGVLVLATGARPLTLPGAEGIPGVHLLRTLDDAARLRPVLAAGSAVVVVGAGWIGAEFATAAREAGCEVTVVEAADRVLAGALPAEVAEPMERWYAQAGASLLTGVRVASVEAGRVLLADGRALAAGAVVVGIGARPATDWLTGSEVELGPDGAVVADGHLRTSVPGVYAVGDCASFPSARYGARLLVHHWDNALQGPRAVAADIVARASQARDSAAPDAAAPDSAAPGPAGPVYDPVPYFWSEQFGRFVQYAGHHGGADAPLWRGDPAADTWSVCWLRDGALAAVLAVGRPRDLAQGRRLIESGVAVDPAKVADPAIALKSTVL